MCQSKTTGNGKRCLRHSGASVAEVHFSWAKTGVDKNTIYATLKELNKEGRKLDAPELAEVKAFLKKEEFVVKNDPGLSERDRKLILKNLAKANDEAEKQAVSGGAFHAWKNLFSKTVEKIKKPIVAAGLVGVLAFSMAGCAGSLNNNTPDGTSVPSPSSSSAPVACSTENPGPYGDVIAKEEVTDEYGTYCRTTIDPNSDALKYDASKTDMESLTKYGFTEEDAKAAQKVAVTFLSEEVLDSTRLDNYSQSPTEWFDANKKWVNPDSQTMFADAIKADGLSSSGMIVTDGLPSPTVRDGGPRASQTNIQVDRIAADIASGTKEPVLVVRTSVTSVYQVTNAAIVDTIIQNDKTQTEESLKASNPDLFNEDNQTGMLLQGQFVTAFGPGNVETLNGVASEWNLSAGDIKVAEVKF